MHQFFLDNCTALGLRGRIRVAQDGINVTVGGTRASLEGHIEAVRMHPLLLGRDIDFKLAEAPAGPGATPAAVTTHETGFDTLSVRMCKELVTLGHLAQGRADPMRNAGVHLTPQQFHSMLAQDARERAASTSSPSAAASAEGHQVGQATSVAAAAAGSGSAGVWVVPTEDAAQPDAAGVSHQGCQGHTLRQQPQDLGHPHGHPHPGHPGHPQGQLPPGHEGHTLGQQPGHPQGQLPPGHEGHTLGQQPGHPQGQLPPGHEGHTLGQQPGHPQGQLPPGHEGHTLGQQPGHPQGQLPPGHEGHTLGQQPGHPQGQHLPGHQGQLLEQPPACYGQPLLGHQCQALQQRPAHLWYRNDTGEPSTRGLANTGHSLHSPGSLRASDSERSVQATDLAAKETAVTAAAAETTADTSAAAKMTADEYALPVETATDAAAKETVVIDVRNLYETNIGHFSVGGLPLLDPRTRCFSDFPAWLDKNEARLRGRRVLMYCTGGVRCERASAYLREKGDGFQEVYQLKGGIQRYLEAFGDGGFFRGKNFVYDDRVAVGPSSSSHVHPPPTDPSPTDLLPADPSPADPALSSGRAVIAAGRLAMGPSRSLPADLSLTAAADAEAPGRDAEKEKENSRAGEPAAWATQSPVAQETSSAHHPPCSTKSPPSRSEAIHLAVIQPGVIQPAVREQGLSPNAGPTPAAAAVEWSPTDVVGRCMVCSRPWDDYGPRVRCMRCRILLLICHACHVRRGEEEASSMQALPPETAAGGGVGSGGGHRKPRGTARRPPAGLRCELCREREGRRNDLADKDSCRTRSGGERDGSHAPEEGASSRGSPAEERRGAGSRGDARGVGYARNPATAASSGGSVRLPEGGCASIGGRPRAPVPPSSASDPVVGRRRLRILCLHGFRQTGYKLMGRTCGLRKHLDDLADFYFPDAPHLLPHFVKTAEEASPAAVPQSPGASVPDYPTSCSQTAPHHDPVLPTGCGQAGQHHQLENQPTEGESQPTEQLGLPGAHSEDHHNTGPPLQHPQQQGRHQHPAQQHPQLPPPGLHKRAWLLPPELMQPTAGYNTLTYSPARAPVSAAPDQTAVHPPPQPLNALNPSATPDTPDAGWQSAPSYVDDQQYMRQTAGWPLSQQSLRAFDDRYGPFDGVLGFSQGAAVAAALCTQQQQLEVVSRPPSRSFRFAILASGFPSASPEHQQLACQTGKLRLPSIHLFGGGEPTAGDGETPAGRPVGACSLAAPGVDTVEVQGGVGGTCWPPGDDRQIEAAESERLVDLFDPGVGRRVVRHGQGHILPSKRAVVLQLRDFLIQRIEELEAEGAV